ncbi:MAG TPA: DUF2442 domain-containing protein [Rhizomicrobium sp.]|nr:DUF2442 domain-containing protein [Rhizomicrobium sp.]
MSELSLIKVTKAEPRGGYRLWLSFSDDSVGEMDFSDLVSRDGSMVQPLQDQSYFARVFLEMGTPTWPNGFDLAPHALHSDMKKLGLLKRKLPA